MRESVFTSHVGKRVDELTVEGDGAALTTKEVELIAVEHTITVTLEGIATGHDLVVTALVGSLADRHVASISSSLD